MTKEMTYEGHLQMATNFARQDHIKGNEFKKNVVLSHIKRAYELRTDPKDFRAEARLIMGYLKSTPEKDSQRILDLTEGFGAGEAVRVFGTMKIERLVGEHHLSIGVLKEAQQKYVAEHGKPEIDPGRYLPLMR